MRIVVFSDSHSNVQALRRIVFAQPEAEIFLHLGDYERDLDQLRAAFPDKEMYGAPGNGDLRSVKETDGMITCAEKRIFFTHGHRYAVKAGLDDFLIAARSYHADIALYGHTHIAYTQYIDGLYIMNPGSVSLPQQGPPSYGLIDVTQAGIVTRIVPVPSPPTA